jgi:peptidoglycan/LPS O-acetylase OafA/YrhL
MARRSASGTIRVEPHPRTSLRVTIGNLHRDNNFDALRLVAATLVILSHSWALTRSVVDPVVVLTQGHVYAGELGVWVFFAMSGYLVTLSFVHRRSPWAFAEARALRIYPALCIAVAFGVFAGALATTLPLRDYLSDTATWAYFNRNLQFDIRFDLPGVFAHNPFPNAVNGSLWTLPLEAMMYVVVAILGVATLLAKRRAAGAVLVVAIAVLIAQPTWLGSLPMVGSMLYAVPAIAFLLGMLMALFRERIPSRGDIALALLAAGVISVRRWPEVATLYACFAASYCTFWLAFPRVRVRIPESVGDVSYGLYVYAFPVQQLVVWLHPAIGPWGLFCAAFPATFLLAWFSWHLVEKPALALKGLLAVPLLRAT